MVHASDLIVFDELFVLVLELFVEHLRHLAILEHWMVFFGLDLFLVLYRRFN